MNFFDRTEMRMVGINGNVYSQRVKKEDNAFEDIVWALNHTNLSTYYGQIKSWRNCIQAGGYNGLYARLFAEKFEHVYTFEPEPLNFYCLVNNCQSSNITKINSALGRRAEMISLSGAPETNPGMYRVAGPGNIPQIKLDDLNIPNVDFIQLDVETKELEVLYGAELTIKNWKPVIAVEVHLTGDAPVADYLAQFGYRAVAQCDLPGGDVVFAVG